MPPAAATARASSPRAARVATRRAPARARVSPAPRRAPARGRTRPAPRRAAASTGALRLVPAAVGRTAGAVGGIADSGLFIGLVRSRGWIGLLAALLVGIVALNVVTLSLNSRASRTAALSDELKRENSALRGDLAGALANERLRSKAAELGLAYPAAEAIIELRADPGDAAAAAQRLRAGEIQIGAAEPLAPAVPATEAVAATPSPASTEPVAAPTAPVEAPAPQAAAAPAGSEPVGATDPGAEPMAASGGAIAP